MSDGDGLARQTGEAQVLDTSNVLRRHLGDRRFALTLPRAVALQVLHPAIAAALRDHAPNRLWEHKRRTVGGMINIAYSDRDLRSVIRFGHEHVKGADALGRRYHALHPELFFFQHATYVDTLITSIDTFSGGLTPARREQLYAECHAWYGRYGISDRHAPATWTEFTRYFADACAALPPPGADTLALRDQVLRPDAWTPRRLPGFAVRALLHERARELLDAPLRPGDAAAFAVYARAVRIGSALRPPRLRYARQARNPL
ncbi:oxygenase MpaB family protein [Nocardia sp. bgisy134]|uniref:oxygenase MpaB family protein n=1 Tax=Nocardia sp. bgisy134 TaxID=3413789 RepID=UPI003D7635D4